MVQLIALSLFIALSCTVTVVVSKSISKEEGVFFLTVPRDSEILISKVPSSNVEANNDFNIVVSVSESENVLDSNKLEFDNLDELDCPSVGDVDNRCCQLLCDRECQSSCVLSESHCFCVYGPTWMEIFQAVIIFVVGIPNLVILTIYLCIKKINGDEIDEDEDEEDYEDEECVTNVPHYVEAGTSPDNSLKEPLITPHV